MKIGNQRKRSPRKPVRLSSKVVGELTEPIQPTETEPGVFSINLGPDEAKWDQAFELDRRARDLLIAHSPSLLSVYAEAANASLKRDREKKAAQREKDNERLDEADSLRQFVEGMHQEPAEYGRAFLEGASAARRTLGYS